MGAAREKNLTRRQSHNRRHRADSAADAAAGDRLKRAIEQFYSVIEYYYSGTSAYDAREEIPQTSMSSASRKRPSRSESPVARRQPRRRACATSSRSNGSRVQLRSSAAANHDAAGGSSRIQRSSSDRLETFPWRNRIRPASSRN